MPQIIIDLELRVENDLSYIEYIVAQTIVHSYPQQVNQDVLVEFLGIKKNLMTPTLKSLENEGWVILTGDIVEATPGLRKMFSPIQNMSDTLDTEEVTNKIDLICEAFLERLNEMTEQNLQPRKTMRELVKKILKKNPEYTEHHFVAVVESKVKSWLGTDSQKYLHYTTLLRSPERFNQYLDVARDELSTARNR